MQPLVIVLVFNTLTIIITHAKYLRMKNLIWIVGLLMLTNLTFGQKKTLSFINAEIDTTFYPGNSFSCQTKRISLFYLTNREIKLSKEGYSSNDVIYPDTFIIFGDTIIANSRDRQIKPESKENMKVKIKANVDFVFHWKQDQIILTAFEETEKNEIDFDFSIVPLEWLIKNQNNYLKSHPFHAAQIKEKNKGILIIEGLKDEIQESKPFLQQENIEAGVYWLIPKSDDHASNKEPPTIFMVVDETGRKRYIKPVKYWVFMNLIEASRFKEDALGEGMGYHDWKTSNRQSITTLLLEFKNEFVLVAEGNGDVETRNEAKWKMLLDYNVFGNFKCMLPQTVIPSLLYFTVPENTTLSAEELSNMPIIDPVREIGYKKDIPTAFGVASYELREKIACQAIFAINPIEGTVNNLEYLPGVYFLPDYFKVNLINNLPIKEFVERQCEN